MCDVPSIAVFCSESFIIVVVVDSEETACMHLVKNPMQAHLHTSTFQTQHFYCTMSFN
jgi:hypothetical protein